MAQGEAGRTLAEDRLNRRMPGTARRLLRTRSTFGEPDRRTGKLTYVCTLGVAPGSEPA
jgi:hypothetical protein